MKKNARVMMFRTTPEKFADNAIGVGFAVACALFARGREDLMHKIDNNPALASSITNMIAQSWVSDAVSDKSDAELAQSFASLLDDVLAKADASKSGKV